MPLLVDLFVLGLAFIVGHLIRRYFILTSGEQKTNIKFIKDFSLITGSKDIIFTHNKILALNADDRHHELGDTFGCYFGEKMQVFSRDPDLIYKICVNDFQKHRNRPFFDSLSKYMRASLLEARDTEWQSSRRAVGSVLKASKLKMDNVESDVELATSQMIASIDKRIKEAQDNGREPIIDVYQINKNFIMHSILKIIFNTEDLVNFDREYNDVVEEMHKFVTVNYEYIARVCFLIPTMTNLVRPLLGFFDHGKVLGLLQMKLEKILAKSLRDQRDNKLMDSSRLTTIHSLINSHRRGELSREQLMGNAIFLMLAGFATSVDSMSAMMWELARNQKTQDKLRADLLQYGENSSYLDQCINETLRLYPGSLTNRDLGEDVYHKDFKLVKGLSFNINLYSLHRDHKYWGSDALKWKPDRFDKSLVEKFHPAQFIPFGIGPRNCVGYNLAKLELKKFTAQFLLRYKVDICENTQPRLNFVPLGALPYALPIEGPVVLKLTFANANQQ